MGIELKLTDRELPVSPVFVDFLAHRVDGRAFAQHRWHDQLSEELNHAQREIVARAPADAEKVMASDLGRQAITRAYQWLLALISGDLQALQEIQLRYHFINVVGIPRNGGSYLTMELYRALGYEPEAVPNALAHDGFPEAGPFQLNRGANSWIVSLQTMAEYLVMVEHYFEGAPKHSGKIVVPKKLTKGIYAGGFFHRVLGDAVENVLTLRHPVCACISTYEKSGGLPEDGRFRVRSNIEEWCRRDLLYTGLTPSALEAMDYFEVYLRYWEQYHLYVATTGLTAHQDLRIVAYGKERMEQVASRFHRRYESSREINAFQVDAGLRDRHPEWFQRAEPVIRRVAEIWAQVGLRFPEEQIQEAW